MYKKNFIEKTSVARISYDRLQKNNTSGVSGVTWHKRIKKWQANIQFQGIRYHLGYYTDINSAKKIRKAAEKELHRDFWKWYAKNFPREFKKIQEKR